MKAIKMDRCIQCERLPVREPGDPVTRLEVWSGNQMLYCEACARAWERGDFDPDPDE